MQRSVGSVFFVVGGCVGLAVEVSLGCRPWVSGGRFQVLPVDGRPDSTGLGGDRVLYEAVFRQVLYFGPMVSLWIAKD